MDFLRNAVAGVWGLLKPATTSSNPVIAATEASEKEIDLVIKKSEGLTSYADAATTEHEKALVNAAETELVSSTNPKKPTKTNIKQKVVRIRTQRGKPKEEAVEDKNLNDINSKVNNSFRANNLAAAANNTNATKSSELSNDLDIARGVVLDDLPIPDNPVQAQAAAQAAAAAQATPEAAAHFASLVPQVGIASNRAFEADNLQYQANDELNRHKYECLPDVVFEYNEADKQKLTELRLVLIKKNITTLQFRDSCVAESAEQLAGILKNYSGWSIADADTTRVSQLMMSRFTESWTPYLNCPASVDDESVDTQNRIFYNRVTSCLEALGTYSIFLSSPWAAYKATQRPPSISPAHVAPTPPLPAPAESYYVKVLIPPYRYVIGPILDFQNIEGRIFIYVKCYDDDTSTTGTYFWVYRSQSEGLYRVFFKLVPHDSIEKGYDYTQATLVHFKLQLALNKYYDRHAQRGVKNPIVLNTLSRLNYFVGNMSYLQQPTFLDLFPNRANIIPSFYSIPGEANTVWTGLWNGYVTHGLKPRYCDRNRAPPAGHQATECYYVCLIPPTPVTPAGTLGMIGHYYTIDARFGPIIHKGFPMDTIYSGMVDIKSDADYRTQLDAYFPAKYPDDAPAAVRLAPLLNYKFSRHGSQYDNTYPYIFCFTTCCLTSGCSSFEFFLEPDRYKKTFWCQGFRDFTALMTPTPATSPVLSPVLHVVIGSMLTEPDFYLLSLRYNILNVEPLKSYYSSDPRIAEYKKSTQVLMTLGTKERDGSIYQPSIDPYPRHSANRALKALRDTINTANIRYKRRFFSSNEENIKNQRLLVQDKVQRKIEMIKVIAAVAHNTSQTGPGGAGIRVIDTLIQGARGYGVDPAGFRAQVTALRAKIGQLLTLQVTQAPKLRNDLQSYMYNMLPLPDAMETPNPAAIPPDGPMRTPYKDAINFIMASPSAAATAVIQYFSSQILLNGLTEFEDDLTDYALLCLKKNWLGGMMDNAYEASTTMFGDQTHRRLHYFNNAGEFIDMGPNNFTCLNPSDPTNPSVPYLYLHTSSFDEVKREVTGDYPVTVLTLANIYRLDCYYLKIPGNIVKSMSIIYQVSSTIVYTRDVNPTILQAMDMQKIPLSFLPDLPEVLAAKPEGMVGGAPPKAAKAAEVAKSTKAAEVAKSTKEMALAAAAAKKERQAQAQAQLSKKQLEQQQRQQRQEQQQLKGQIFALQNQQGQLEAHALSLGLNEEQLPLLASLKPLISHLDAHLQPLQMEILAPALLHQIQEEVARLLARQLLAQQLLAQQPILRQISTLQTQQIQIEAQVLRLRITQEQIPFLVTLNTQMSHFDTYLQPLQTRLLEPAVLHQIQKQVEEQQAQQQQALEIIQKIQQQQAEQQTQQQQAQQRQEQQQLIGQISTLQTLQTQFETEALTLGLTQEQLPLLASLKPHVLKVVSQLPQLQGQLLQPAVLHQIQEELAQLLAQQPQAQLLLAQQVQQILAQLAQQAQQAQLIPEQLTRQQHAQQILAQLAQLQKQQQLIGQISTLQTEQTQLETQVSTLGLPEKPLENLKAQVLAVVSQLPQLQGQLLQGQLLQPELLQQIQQQAQLLLAQQPQALQEALIQVQAQASQQAQQQQAEQHQLMGQQAQQQQAEQAINQQLMGILGPMVYSFLFSEYTSCATHRRVASYGGFFAGKMMEYFFSTHMQLPSFFKYFESYLKICVQYNTTALIYDADVPPYNLIELQRPGAPPPSFKLPFFQYFQKMKIVLVPGSAADGSGNARYIETILQQKTADIKAISKFLTNDFMIDPDVADNGSFYSRGSTLSTASSSTNSSEESKSFCSFDEDSIGSSGALEFFLLLAPLEGSVVGDLNFQNIDDPGEVGLAPEGGGNKPRLTTVATTKRNRKYKSRSSPKRKSKSNNKSKSRHKRNSKVTNKTFCRKRKSYLSRKPFKKQTLRKGVKR